MSIISQKIGSKKVKIRTQEKESLRITAILTVLASRQMLLPMPIFKSNEGKN